MCGSTRPWITEPGMWLKYPAQNPETPVQCREHARRGPVHFARHCGVTVLTCQPADPAATGGVEASVKLAKPDLVPRTPTRGDYASFGELEAACEAFVEEVNNREHAVSADEHPGTEQVEPRGCH
ncbi:hypothetical protein J7I85_24205 [Arthrobacter sp. ISL-65]|nr:hypothetical protein [Arthrobacter sp. ISL-65]